MITTICGKNAFLMSQKLKELVSSFVSEHGDIAMERLDGEEATYDAIRESLESLPFLAPKKLVVLRSPSAQKQFVESAEDLLSNLSESTDVIIYEPQLDKRTSYSKFLKKSTEYIELNELEGFQLTKWLVEEAKQQSGSLSSADASYLVERVGNNQQLLFNELQKLLSFDPNITKKTIDLLCEPSPRSTIFDLLEAAFNHQPKKAIAMYEEQRRMGVEPIQIIAMLAWQLHALATVLAADGRTNQQIANEAKMNPYVVGKTKNLARNLNVAQVRGLIKKLLDIDEKSKTAPIDIDTALKAYLLLISS